MIYTSFHLQNLSWFVVTKWHAGFQQHRITTEGCVVIAKTYSKHFMWKVCLFSRASQGWRESLSSRVPGMFKDHTRAQSARHSTCHLYFVAISRQLFPLTFTFSLVTCHDQLTFAFSLSIVFHGETMWVPKPGGFANAFTCGPKSHEAWVV